MAKNNWIEKAVKHKGALHMHLHMATGKIIPAKKLNAAAKKKGVVGKEAVLAKTLKKFHKKK